MASSQLQHPIYETTRFENKYKSFSSRRMIKRFAIRGDHLIGSRSDFRAAPHVLIENIDYFFKNMLRDHDHLDGLTLYGLAAVSLMLATYALEERGPWFILAFAGACCLGSIYGFLQGAWPFGLVEAIWALVALRRWSHHRRLNAAKKPAPTEG